MATFSITTTDQQDKAVQYRTNQANAAKSPGDPDLTPLQYARKLIDHWLDGIVQSVLEETRVSKGDLYNRASDADKATIDAILNQYR